MRRVYLAHRDRWGSRYERLKSHFQGHGIELEQISDVDSAVNVSDPRKDLCSAVIIYTFEFNFVAIITKIRERGFRTPLLVVGPPEPSTWKIESLQMGADACISDPQSDVEMGTFVAQLNAIIRGREYGQDDVKEYLVKKFGMAPTYEKKSEAA